MIPQIVPAISRIKKIRDRGAIAGRRAAEIYNMDILEEGIETEKMNYTRFFILEKDQSDRDWIPNKSSIYFRLKHKPGSLAKILTKIAFEGMNLSKIQSFPIPNVLSEYYIHLDIEYEDFNQYQTLMKDMKNLCTTLGELGSYKKAKIL